MTVDITLDGRAVTVEGSHAEGSLLDALRGVLGARSVKDGCSPQGQCGACTVLVDGKPRVSCVTPLRRVAGRSIETLDGLASEVRDRWADSFTACGASQCGFCTPGILMRLEGLRRERGPDVGEAAVERALAAHLCRCTGWRTILEAWVLATGADAADPVGTTGRDLDAASRRATMELGAPQQVGTHVALGAVGFSADTAPDGCLVAVQDAAGRWAVGEDLASARRAAGRVQGRRSSLEAEPPIAVPPGDWVAELATSWVDPAYVETDASWCEPGGTPSPPAANGGAFGGKRDSPLPAVARELADLHGRAVLALWTREDCVRRSPKRPPVAGGVRADGTGELVVARTQGVIGAIVSAAPGLIVSEVDVAGPPTSVAVRGAGWLEATVLLAGAGAGGPALEVEPGPDGGAVRVTDRRGGVATARFMQGVLSVEVDAGDPLDEVVLRSYCVGAAHMGASLVTSESLAVDADGDPHDLTVRSLGVLGAAATPPVEVAVSGRGGEPVAVSEAVMAAVAAVVWRSAGCPSRWPTGTALR